MTVRQVSEQYNFSTKQLRSFIQNRKTKGKNYDQKGRCPIIDSESRITIESRYKDGMLKFPSEAHFRSDLRKTIRDEAILSYARKTGTGTGLEFFNKKKEISKIISERTLKRRVSEYMNLFIKYVSINDSNNIFLNKI